MFLTRSSTKSVHDEVMLPWQPKGKTLKIFSSQTASITATLFGMYQCLLFCCMLIQWAAVCRPSVINIQNRLLLKNNLSDLDETSLCNILALTSLEFVQIGVQILVIN